jgi:uncharacterized protein YutE (UPF0331/DUF86 family)
VTDPDLIAKKLAFIETCVRDLRLLGRPDQIENDLKEERFAAHTLQLAIQAALDVASHVVSDQRLGEPETNRDLFRRLATAGILSAVQGETLARMVGFRNILVHGYQEVDRRIVRDVVENRLDDLLAFTAALRSYLSRT